RSTDRGSTFVAVGTSLLVITMNCAVGFYGHAGQVQIAWPAVATVTAGTLPGIAAGTLAMRFVSQPSLRRGFAALLVVLAVYMLYQNLTA
ncbi:MAG: sulfite exporter TauE/SafE family protein, partial [Acidobacteriota bacterium]